MRKKLVIGSRGSNLALIQAESVLSKLRGLYPDIDFSLVKITTGGDRERNIHLHQMAGDGIFVKELEEAKKNADLGRKAKIMNELEQLADYLTSSESREFICIRARVRNRICKRIERALDEIKKFFKAGQKILLIQNGIDNEDRAAEKLSEGDVLRFVINYAGMIVRPGAVKISFFHPPNYIGALSPDNETLAREIAGFISEAGLETAFTPEIKKYEWRKTILNAALMPVCATTGLTMKEAMEHEETRFLTEQILQESIQVAKKLGYEFEDDFVEKGLAYLSGAGHHKPSMSLDLEAGNLVEYVYQPIIDYGKEIDSPTPYLESLTKVVWALEKEKRKSKS